MELSLIFLFPLLALLVYTVLYRLYKSEPTDHRSIPTVGIRNEIFKSLRAAVRQLKDSVNIQLYGYTRYSRSGRPFFVPNLDFRDEMMLPPEHIRWFAAQQESDLSTHKVRDIRHPLKHLRIGMDDKSTTLFLTKVVNDTFTRKLDMLHEAMYHEVRSSVGDVLGKSGTVWQTLNIYDTMQEINSRVVTRIMFGAPICRDPYFLRSYRKFMTTIGIGAMVINQLPAPLRAIAGPLFSIPLWYYQRKILKFLVPVVQRRLSDMEKKDNGVGDDNDDDVLAQCIRSTLKDKNLRDVISPTMLVQQTLGLAFSSTFPTSSHLAHFILDIVTCSSDARAYERLREEAESVFQTTKDWEDAPMLKRLVLMNSAIRESLRFHPPLINGLTREVVKPDGLRLPEGTLIPQGTWIGVPIYSVHTDGRFYPNGSVYDPFRFIEPYKAPVAPGSEETSSKKGGQSKELHAGQTSDRYLGWGYGRHACPGRWLVVHLTKVMMAYIVINYDMQATGPAPKMTVLGDSPLPPLSETIKVRRRECNEAASIPMQATMTD